MPADDLQPVRHRRMGPIRRLLGRRPLVIGSAGAAVLVAAGIGLTFHDGAGQPASAPPVVSLADRAGGNQVSRDLARVDPASQSPSPSASPSPSPSFSPSPSPSPSPTHAAAPRTHAPVPTRAATTKATTKAATPAGCGDYSGNQLIACQLLPSFGFSTSEMPALVQMWDRESGWNPTAENPSSGAYGIPQALPGDKMASVASDWQTDAATQIKWGLGYIKDQYGTPSDAWAFWQANGWY
ncbi:hypothetical protein GCM10023322_01860 [Rugosimonospora acidiphila]|uniref:Transglycosylase SLT domain-containing protein n=1 Tax=Rugosimonospora acidiphila TaxID=556531 RepID=A0ABP9RHM3_9ACTN